MTMTDPIADMLTRIRNANVAHFETVRMPGSKLKESLASILAAEGYIAGYQVGEVPGKPGKTLEITMKYTSDRAAHDLRHQACLQAGAADLRPGGQDSAGARRSRGGGGLHLQRAHDRPRACQKRMGGEVLCYVW